MVDIMTDELKNLMYQLTLQTNKDNHCPAVSYSPRYNIKCFFRYNFNEIQNI